MYYSKDKDKRKKMNKGTPKRMAYSDGGVVQYENIEDKVEKCTARVGMNTMK
jgi:hypothetical protein|tara:strand:+ start:920 stop:1075 length:156 start_codon:yes stop_codon:yes gene_type:complete